MNKERAKEVLNQIKDKKVEYLTIEDIQEPESEDIPRIQEQIQVLDIAIESLDNTMTNREYMHLVGVQAILDTKFDLDKPLEKDFVKFLYALNQVEPYERKE